MSIESRGIGPIHKEQQELVEQFLKHESPPEIRLVFENLERELITKEEAVRAVVPLMSLQGEWAIKKLSGMPRGYGDIDWGVILDCPAEEREEMLREVTRFSSDYFVERELEPCESINPSNYYLNLAELSTVWSSLPEAARLYVSGDISRAQEVVNAALPYLSNNVELIQKFEQEMAQGISPADLNVVRDALRQCVDWMHSVKGKTDINSENARSLNIVRRISHEEFPTNEAVERMPGSSFGVIAIKPDGMTSDIPEIVEYVLSLSGKEGIENDDVIQVVTKGMTEEEIRFFVSGLTKIRKRMTSFGDYENGQSFWDANYTKRHMGKFWYEHLMKYIHQGTLSACIVEGDMSAEDMQHWLDIFKGKENIIQTEPDQNTKVIRAGKGLRGLYDTEAVLVPIGRVKEAYEQAGIPIPLDIQEESSPQELLFSGLPDAVASFVWEELTEEQKTRMISNYVHMTGKQEEALEGSFVLVQRELGDTITNQIRNSDLSDEDKIRVLLDIQSMIREAWNSRLETESGITRGLFPEDGEKSKHSYGMLVVKPTGMSGDFPDLMNYLFDPTCRDDEHFEQVVETLAQTFEEEYRPQFRRILESTVYDATFYQSFEPDEEPYFWEAHYLKKNGGKFYYKALVDGFRGGRPVEIYLLRSNVDQEELDDWIKKVKGRENLYTTHTTDAEIPEEEMLYKGYGIRGLLGVEAIMLTEEKKTELLEQITDPSLRQTIANEIADIELPIIFSRLPAHVQEVLWDALPSYEQQAMISNFIHSPDDLATTYDAMLALARTKLSPEQIAEIIQRSNGAQNEAIYDLVTEILKKEVAGTLNSEESRVLSNQLIGNIRALKASLS